MNVNFDIFPCINNFYTYFFLPWLFDGLTIDHIIMAAFDMLVNFIILINMHSFQLICYFKYIYSSKSVYLKVLQNTKDLPTRGSKCLSFPFSYMEEEEGRIWLGENS